MSLLEAITIEPKHPAEFSVIWLHGLGADGYDFADIVPMLKLKDDHTVRFIFPHAPVRNITMNMGMPMRAWFDMSGVDQASLEKTLNGIIDAAKDINALIEQEVSRGIAEKNIILAGFSQGGALAIYCGLTYPKPIAGILALSTCFLAQLPNLSPNRSLPIFLAHGRSDPLIPFRLAEITRENLTRLNMKVEWHEYAMAHTVCPQEIIDIGQFINLRISQAE